MDIYKKDVQELFQEKLFDVIENTPDRSSLHECLGFMEEEFHEFRQEVFKKEFEQCDEAIIKEALDVMVTAARAVIFIQTRHRELNHFKNLNHHG